MTTRFPIRAVRMELVQSLNDWVDAKLLLAAMAVVTPEDVRHVLKLKTAVAHKFETYEDLVLAKRFVEREHFG